MVKLVCLYLTRGTEGPVRGTTSLAYTTLNILLKSAWNVHVCKIGILKKFLTKYLGVLRGVFEGLGVQMKSRWPTGSRRWPNILTHLHSERPKEA